MPSSNSRISRRILDKNNVNNKAKSQAVFYWRIVKSKVILGLVLMLLVKLYLLITKGLVVALDRSGGWDWVIAVIVFILLGWQLARKLKVHYKRIVFIGAWAGFYLGLLIAIIDLIMFRNAWALLNIIRKPILFIIMGAAVTLIIYLMRARENGNLKKVNN